MSKVLDLTKALVAIDSVTPDDKGVQEILIERLLRIGFVVKRLPFGAVANFWACRGNSAPLFAFAGHTDVVPVGDEQAWTFPPFVPTIKNGILYGRGVADMKGGIAAFVVAVENFVKNHPHHEGSIGFLITSDEEGPAVDGTEKVLAWLNEQGIRIDYCLVGEPSSLEVVGDVIKNGRRGSLSGHLTIRGKQGHIAYPYLANNPIHSACGVLAQLINHQWDKGNEYFPPTSLQISNINAGMGVANVIPADIGIMFNFRYSSEQTSTQLQSFVGQCLDEAGLNYRLDWQHSGKPFITSKGHLLDVCLAAIKKITNRGAKLSTSGGTSDGRFIAQYGVEVLELGVVNATIHQVDECTKLADLETLTQIYQAILEGIFN